MNYNHPARNDSTMTIAVVCAFIFVVFSFLWLYFFQSDLLAAFQHVLSAGQTSYNHTVGAVIITLVLWLLQMGVCSVLKLKRYAYALTFFPSMLLLAVLTSAGQDTGFSIRFGVWLWLFPLLLLGWYVLVSIVRNVQNMWQRIPTGLFSRCSWANMMQMVLMIIGVAVISNTNAVFHFRMHAESALNEGDYNEALRVGSRSHETDGNLMMLRMYALSRQGLLGERLFHYPLVPSSEVMLPTDSTVLMVRYPVDSLYRYLGAKPKQSMKPMDYLAAIVRSHKASPAAADYILCGYLLDKDIDAFAREVSRYYPINSDSLPRHYREALVLYNHRRSNPVITYKDAVLDVDYNDLQKLEASCQNDTERKGKVMESYANSYWYFFDYVSQ